MCDKGRLYLKIMLIWFVYWLRVSLLDIVYSALSVSMGLYAETNVPFTTCCIVYFSVFILARFVTDHLAFFHTQILLKPSSHIVCIFEVRQMPL